MKSKRLMPFLTAAVMLFSSLSPLSCLSVSAEEKEVTVNGLNFTISNGEATLTGATKSPVNLVVPSTVNGVPVTKIGEDAFYENKVIETVSVPSSVKVMEAEAFRYCENLTKVTMAEGVQSIGSVQFYFCQKLKEINIPKSLTSIGSQCFTSTAWIYDQRAKSKNGLVIFNNILIDGVEATGNCKIPETVTQIAANAFINSEIYQVFIPKSISYIPQGAFSYCKKLAGVTVANPNCVFACMEENKGEDIYYCCFFNIATSTGGFNFSGPMRGYLGSTAQAYAEKHHVWFNIQGDIDRDGKLTADDSNLILIEYLTTDVLNGATTMTREQAKSADYDFDDKITADDANDVLYAYLDALM